ncbi:MAG TPA: ATP-binding protein [Terriglobales bacterium]|nr:ATP-binding protein [Terriglobales bacterium]
MIVVMVGLPGTGKSTLAHALASQTAGVVLNKDEVRATLFPAADVEYSREQDDFCMGVLLDAAAYLLKKNPARTILIDGRPFSKTQQLEQVINAAEQLGQAWKIVECTCRAQTARVRLEDQSTTHPAANRDYTLYLKIKSEWQEILLPKVVIDTDHSFAQCVKEAARAIKNPSMMT